MTKTPVLDWCRNYKVQHPNASWDEIRSAYLAYDALEIQRLRETFRKLNDNPRREDEQLDPMRTTIQANVSGSEEHTTDQLPEVLPETTYQGWADAGWLCTIGHGCVCGENCRD